MVIGDLFSGIGGFSLAAHWMGWRANRSSYSTPINEATREHDAIDAWWKEQLAAKDAEIARLSRPRVAPSHKGVTYREGKWCASLRSDDTSNIYRALACFFIDPTDDDHAALLALKDAKPVPLGDEILKLLYLVWDAGRNRGWPKDNIGGISEVRDRILALVGEAP